MRPRNNKRGLTNITSNTIDKYGLERCLIVRKMSSLAGAKDISIELRIKQSQIIRMIDAANEYKPR